jgi:serine/threonine protein kinase
MTSGPVGIQSKLKLRKELDDLASLKYHITQGKIDTEYRITNKILGKGSYAIVKLAEKIDNINENVAVKIYEKSKLYSNKHRRKNLCSEIMVLKSLDHKNILKLIKVYEDRTNVYLIMEYIKGMSLYRYLKERSSSSLSEHEAKFIFREILNTLNYMHQKGIAHRDVKLENIIVTNEF